MNAHNADCESDSYQPKKYCARAPHTNKRGLHTHTHTYTNIKTYITKFTM